MKVTIRRKKCDEVKLVGVRSIKILKMMLGHSHRQSKFGVVVDPVVEGSRSSGSVYNRFER